MTAPTITHGLCEGCGDRFHLARLSTVDVADDGAPRSYDVTWCPQCYEDFMGEAPDLDPVHVRVTHEGGRVEYLTLTEGPAFEALVWAPYYTTWSGWSGVEYVSVP